MKPFEGTIAPWGNGRAVRIPKHILDSVGLKDNDKVEISVTDNKITIEPVKKKKKQPTLREIVEEFYGVDFETAVKENPYDVEFTDWGEPVGEEIW